MSGLAALFRALVVRYALMHRTRSVLTLLSVAVGVAVTVAVRSANASAVASFANAANSVAPDTSLQIVSLGDGIPEHLMLALQRVQGVAGLAPIVNGTLTDERMQRAYDLLGIDMLSALGLASQTHAPNLSRRGRVELSPAVLQRGAIILAGSLAQRLSARMGSRISFEAGVRSVPLQVAGIVADAALPPAMRSIVMCDISTAQEVLNRRGLLDRIDIIPAPHTDLGRLRRSLRELLPPGVELTTPGERAAQTARMSEEFRFNLAALAAIAMLVGSYLVLNAVSISVVQRRPEIGVARALGAPRRAIFAIFLLEGAVAGVLGSALGVVLGRLLAVKALAVASSTIDALYVTLNAAQLVNLPLVYLQGAALGVGLSTLASVIPAIEAASVAPTMAMRVGSWEKPRTFSYAFAVSAAAAAFLAALVASRLGPLGSKPVFGYAAALLTIFGSSLLAAPAVVATSAAARWVAGARWGPALELAPLNVQARARRNAIAVATLMIGVAMTVSVGTLIASFRDTVAAWIHATVRGDLYISPTGAVNAADVSMPGSMTQAVSRLAGVAEVEAIRSRLILFHGRLTNLAASDIVRSPAGQLTLLSGGDWRTVRLALMQSDAVIVSEPFMRKFGLRERDRLQLSTPSGTRSLRVAGVYRDYASDLGYILMDRALYSRLYGDTRINAIAVYALPGYDLGRLRARMIRTLGNARVLVRSNAQLRASALQEFDRTFAVTYALDAIALIVSLAGIVTALAALVVERRQEIGVLRCLGMTRKQVRTMIVGEATLLGASGGILGLSTGYALACILIFVINRQAFGWTIAFSPTPVYDLRLFAIVLLTAALAGILPASAAAALPVAETIRSE